MAAGNESLPLNAKPCMCHRGENRTAGMVTAFIPIPTGTCCIPKRDGHPCGGYESSVRHGRSHRTVGAGESNWPFSMRQDQDTIACTTRYRYDVLPLDENRSAIGLTATVMPSALGRRSHARSQSRAAAARPSWSGRRSPRRSPPRTTKLAVDTIARMIARQWDANGRAMPDTEQQPPGHPDADNPMLTKLRSA